MLDHSLIEQLNQLPYDELKSVSDTILEMLDDKKWDALFSSPKSIAYAEKMYRELENAECIAYIPGKSLEELFQ